MAKEPERLLRSGVEDDDGIAARGAALSKFEEYSETTGMHRKKNMPRMEKSIAPKANLFKILALLCLIILAFYLIYI